MTGGVRYRVTGAYAVFRRFGPTDGVYGTYLEFYRGKTVSMAGVPPETVAHLQAMQLITPIDPDLEDPS